MNKGNPHTAGYWTPERLMEEGKKYQTKGEFKKFSPSAYATACRSGLIASMNWFIDGRHKKRGPYKGHKYTKDIVATIIKENNCVTVTDLRLVNEYAYKQARDNNWLAELGIEENKHEDGYWTEERVWEVAKLYTNKTDFAKYEPVARSWASKYGLLDKMTWMRSPTYDERRDKHDSEVYAFVDEVKKVAYVGLSIDTKVRKRSHRNDKKSAVKKFFGKKSPEPIVLKSQLTIDESTYWEDYYKKEYLNKGYSLLNVARTGLGTGSIGGVSKWSSKEDVFEESHKYHSRTEFKKKSGGAYNHALYNGWLDEMTWLNSKNVYKDPIDTVYKYDRAIIYLPDGTVVDGKVQSWTDFEDGDQIQVKIDGVTYLVHSSDIALIAD